MAIPADPEVLDRIGMRRPRVLAVDVASQLVLGDRGEEARLVAKQAVDRRRLHPRLEGDGTCGRRVAAALGNEGGGRRDDTVAKLRTVLLGGAAWLHEINGITISITTISNSCPSMISTISNFRYR